MVRRLTATLAAVLALTAAVTAAIAGGAASDPPSAVQFTDWTAVGGGVATGTLFGSTVSLSGSHVWTPPQSVLDGSWTAFDGPDFTPPQPRTDEIQVSGFANFAYTLTFARPTTDPVLLLGSLAERLDFPSGTQISQLAGDSNFTVSGNSVTGAFVSGVGRDGINDANGTIELVGTFTSVSFTTTPVFNAGSEDGVLVQVGASPPASPPPTTTTSTTTAPTSTASSTTTSAPPALPAPSVSVVCTPRVLSAAQSATCTATLTDRTGTPTGQVTFASATGSFPTGAACQLTAGSCSIRFTSAAQGTITIAAAYRGDAGHAGAHGSTTVASAPIAGRTAAVAAVNGTVLIREGGTFVPLSGGAISVRPGATIDARKGVVRIATAADDLPATNRHHRLQTGTFAAAMFTIEQQRGHHRDAPPATDVILRTAPGAVTAAGCTRRHHPAKGIVRQLRAVAKGVYRTIAGAATITTTRTTTWAVQDRCDGTFTRVARVHATVTRTRGGRRGHTIHLSAGQSALVAAEQFTAAQEGAGGGHGA